VFPGKARVFRPAVPEPFSPLPVALPSHRRERSGRWGRDRVAERPPMNRTWRSCWPAAAPTGPSCDGSGPRPASCRTDWQGGPRP